MNEDFLENEGQFWLKNNNDEVIGIVRNVKNKTITFDVTAEYFTFLQAQDIIEKYGKIEKEIYINFDGGYGAKKNNNGEVFLHYQTHELSKKDNYSDRGEVLETLFWMRENFYPFFDGMKNIEYKISSKIPIVDNYTVTMKFQDPTKTNTPDTFSIEENNEVRSYFNDLKDHKLNELTYGENYIFSQNFDSNTFLGLYTETVTKEFVDYIEKSINCNVLKTEKDFENFIESFNIASRDGEKIESVNINSGYENGIKFSKALPEVWVNMNNGSYAYSKKDKLIVGSSFYRENRLEQMHEIFKKVEKINGSDNLEIKVGKNLLNKNCELCNSFQYKTTEMTQKNIDYILKNNELRPFIGFDDKKIVVAFEKDKVDEKLLNKIKNEKKSKELITIEGSEIVNLSEKNQNKNKTKRSS